MAARLTDAQKKKIIADYVENGSYRATAKLNNVSATAVKNIVLKDSESVQKFAQKKSENTLDMLAYMESRKEQAKEILDTYLETLKDPEKIAAAKLSEVATTMGIVIDKFVNTPLKNQLDRQKLELEIAKLETQIKDTRPEEEAEDNFLDALNGTAAEVWEEREVEEDETN